MNDLNGFNPDVLSCLANLSNDEVFTPPHVVDEMLDLLPTSIWSNRHAKFLDPCCKSGIFLREITKRLIEGLKNEIPDLQERIDHILSNQIYGIAITELTSLISRRSVYCSKNAVGEYSVCTTMFYETGNIFYENRKHTWVNGSCKFCGASQEQYDRDADSEFHAYSFIHNVTFEELKNMKFDVIIGNPPYQLSDGGAQKSASPIYQKFVEQALKLNPTFLTMIIPARWYSGGKGLDDFRELMLGDSHISEIHDFPETSDCFPGVNIRGGVCYFLRDSNYSGPCNVYNHAGKNIDVMKRNLLFEDSGVFIRYNKAIGILEKVLSKKEQSFMPLVSSRKPFGFPTNYSNYSQSNSESNNIELYRFGDNGFISESDVMKNKDWINKYKIFEPYASPGTDDYPHLVLSKPIVAPPGSVCTETYLVIGPFESESEAQNVESYMRTQFFRFMLVLLKITQHVTQKVYQFVPMQSFDKSWTDEELYAKYGITDDEIDFINSLVKPLE